MRIDEETLVEVITKLEDYNEATNAFTELKYLNPVKAGEIAVDVLESGKGDSHFQASAFEVLYSTNQQNSLAYINGNFDSVNLVILKSMLECVSEDSPLVRGDSDLLQAVKRLNERVNKLDSKDCEKLGDSLGWFRSTYANLLAGRI